MFSQVTARPPDPLFGLNDAFKRDTDPRRMNLGVGAYRDEDGNPWVLPVVAEVEKELAESQKYNKEYLPILGLPEFREAAAKLLLGDGCKPITEEKVGTIQTLSGTGALSLAMKVIGKLFPNTNEPHTIFISNPTWANHKNIIQGSGLQWKEYRYYNPTTGFDFPGMLEDLRACPEQSIVLLHVVAHNPTGYDPGPDQWMQILDIVKERKLYPLFDCAYQGFASGDLDKDAFSVRLFAEEGLEMICCQSFSKNLGLYGERAGSLIIVSDSTETRDKVLSQVSNICRQEYSNPPRHGAEIVATVLHNETHFSMWSQNLKLMADRIIDMRKVLFEELKACGAQGEWDHIVAQQGMFSFLGINHQQADRLVNEHHVYLTKNGRISMAGLNAEKAKYLAGAIKETLEVVGDGAIKETLVGDGEGNSGVERESSMGKVRRRLSGFGFWKKQGKK